MDFKHRFNVRRVSEVRGLTGIVNEGMMQDVPENDVLQLDTTATAPVASKVVPDDGSSTYPPGNHDGKVRRGSLAQLTREALPRLDYYRNCMQAMKRPSIGELHGEPIDPKHDLDAEAQKPEVQGASHGVKLGWIQGVLIPCLLNIWGVMLFLRLSWVVAQSGVGESLVIIAISAVVCVLTTLSLSAISTNGEVKGGGIYYIISRSLGPEFGASIGIVFAFANAVAASMNTIGFCDSLNDLLSKQGLMIVDGGVNDVRIVGTIAILVMCVICAVGMEWESKAQNVLVVIIVGAIIDFLAGAIVGPRSDDAISKGFTGFNMTVMAENWYPSYRYSEFTDQNFFTVFSIFFPSVTGIQAGANISGDLKDAAMAIPRGTLLALLISMFSYAIFVIFAGAASVRDASGIAEEVGNWTQYDCALNNTCQWGLMNSYSMMQVISLWGPLIYAGCFAATLSTALTNLLSVPRLIQALGIDRIYPGLIFFSKGYGKAGEPYRGYVLTFLISVAFLLIAELNVIAPLISNFYLASYALINFCTFHAALVKPLGWRPTFKYYSMWLSLIGFLLCVCIMFLIDWVTSLVTFGVVFALYLLVVYRKPDVNWGSSTQAQTYKTALTAAQRLVNVSEHVKNYRPQILVLTGRTSVRPPLVDMANLITKSSALMLCGEVHQERLSYRARQRKIRSSYTWLQANKVKAFYTMVDGIAFETGARALLQSTGIGKLRPNVLLMGYKRDWRTCSTTDLTAYFNILHDAFENRLSVAILRMADGLDYSRITDAAEAAAEAVASATVSLPSMDSTTDMKPPQSLANALMRTDSNSSIANMHHSNGHHYLTFSGSQDETLTESPHSTRRYVLTDKTDMGSPLAILKNKKKAVAGQMLSNSSPSGKDISNMTFFKQKQPPGSTIDVWWLYDDGGLTILLPYIINLRHNWASCKLRVFALVNRHQEAELEERNMASLLSKFRIDYQSLTMVTGITEKPQAGTVTFFEELLNGFKEDETSDPDIRVTKIELASMQQKTDRQLRLRELLLENSKSAALIFMSLPMPRKGTVSAPLYMAWLEVLTKDMPPFVLVRGNHTSVLTFYS